MRKWLTLLFFPLTVQAAGEGAWQDSGMGRNPELPGGFPHRPRRWRPRQPVSGLMTLVAWRYELNGPTPAGLRVRLCSQSRCVELDGQSGTTHGFANVPAAEPLRFVWEIPGGGRLIPALNVRSNQVIVNYR
ncbi:flagellar protein FlhE [Salmonella bongori]|nr:flagellar protein FlhE [Salmonella bongori]